MGVKPPVKIQYFIQCVSNPYVTLGEQSRQIKKAVLSERGIPQILHISLFTGLREYHRIKAFMVPERAAQNLMTASVGAENFRFGN